MYTFLILIATLIIIRALTNLIDNLLYNNKIRNILLLIELNDGTHQLKKRKARDAKVKNM